MHLHIRNLLIRRLDSFNPQVTKSKTTLRALLANVGRRCDFLDLTESGHITADILSGLLGLEEDDWSEPNQESRPPIQLKTLILDKTGIDDAAMSVLTHCTELRSLHLGSARIGRTVVAYQFFACPDSGINDRLWLMRSHQGVQEAT